MNKHKILITAIVIILIFLVTLFIFTLRNKSKSLTFDECESNGGYALLVDLSNPEYCPECVEYYDCYEKYQNVYNLEKFCPSLKDCEKCMENNFPYPQACPDQNEKIGDISDAAIWFICCK